MNIENIVKIIEQDIRKYFKRANIKKAVIGNSGGKDSAVVIGLLARALGKENVLTYSLPCHSIKQDSDHAKLVADKFGVKYDTVTLDKVCDDIEKTIAKTLDKEVSDDAKINIKPRLRMTALYAIAQTEGALVVGTGNKCERYVGYFTKFGDGGCDYNPIAELYVSEVYEIARYIGVPKEIIEKAPSDGLSSKSDEDKMGVTYKQIEEYIKTGKTDKEAEAIIERMYKASIHKRKMPVIFERWF